MKTSQVPAKDVRTPGFSDTVEPSIPSPVRGECGRLGAPLRCQGVCTVSKRPARAGFRQRAFPRRSDAACATASSGSAAPRSRPDPGKPALSESATRHAIAPTTDPRSSLSSRYRPGRTQPRRNTATPPKGIAAQVEPFKKGMSRARSAVVTHIGDGCRAAGFLPIAMSPRPRPQVVRFIDFCHRLLALPGCSPCSSSPAAFALRCWVKRLC